MKYITILATTATLLASAAFAQMVEADDETVEALRQLVLSNGEECATVTDMQPEGVTGLRLTCQKQPNNNATAVYLIEVSDNGLSVTRQ